MSDFFRPDDFPPGFSVTIRKGLADCANRLLKERGAVVYGRRGMDGWYQKQFNVVQDLDTALLVNIQPIEQDTAEKVLRDLMKDWVKLSITFPDILERAKKLSLK